MQLLVLVLNKVDCLQAILCGLMKANVTGTTVLEQSQVAPVKAIIDKAVGGISNPNTGIMFTIDLSSVDGLRA